MDGADDTRSEFTSSGTTLRTEALLLSRRLEPRVLVAGLAIGLAARVFVGGFSLWDLVVVGGILVVFPFLEWMIHRYLFHFTPRPIFGRQFDLQPRQAHARHHEFPDDPSTVLIGPRGIVVVILGVAVLSVAMPTLGLSSTFWLTGMALALVYEWSHYLMHEPYQARRRLYRQLRRSHLRHHNVEEDRNYGITTRIADHVFRTAV